MEAQQRWFAEMMKAGIKETIFTASDVMSHVTPEVLAEYLPADLMAQLFQASLGTGAMTPERILEIVTPEVLGKHIPHDVLWSCISSAARRAGISERRE